MLFRSNEANAAQAGCFFVGLVTGISVMLLAFGPGVYFLFAERADRIRQRPAQRRNLDQQPGTATDRSTLDV